MTTVVTADKLVNALAARISAGESAKSVSGPNKQLRDAMVAKEFFDGTSQPPVGGGAPVMYAQGIMTWGTMWDAAKNGIVTGDAVWNQYPDAARDTPLDALYKKWVWDTTNVNDSAFGSWSGDKSRFIFNKRCLATVTFRGGLVLLTSAYNFENAITTLITGNTSTLPNGRFGPAQEAVNHYVTGASAGWVHINMTLTQEFNVGDFVEARYVCHTVNGTASLAYYGSLRGIVSRMDITLINEIK